MASHKHEHASCLHEDIKFCRHCNIVFCKDCDITWHQWSMQCVQGAWRYNQPLVPAQPYYIKSPGKKLYSGAHELPECPGRRHEWCANGGQCPSGLPGVQA